MTRRGVAVYGASGYTGRLVAHELLEMGHDVVIAGRSRASLEALPAELLRTATIRVVGLDDASGLRELCASVRTVVNAAGPFSASCEPIARAAVQAGCHYVDVSGEQRALRFLTDELASDAIRANVALLPASAFYGALADLLVAVAARDFGRVDDLDIAYRVTDWVPSGSSYVARLQGADLPTIQYDNGFVELASDPATRFVDFGDHLGRHRVTSYPAPEVLMIPRHVDLGRLRTSVTASMLVPRWLERFVPRLRGMVALGLRSPIAGLVERLVGWLSGGASRQRVLADPTRFDLVAHLRGPAGKRSATLSGSKIFDISAPICARVVARTLQDNFDARGPLAAAQLFDAATFLDGLAERGVSYQVGPVANIQELSC